MSAALRVLPSQRELSSDQRAAVAAIWRDELLRALHPDGYRDFRAFRDGTTSAIPLISAGNLESVEDVVSAERGRNLYVGVASRASAKGRKTEDCLALHAVFAETDFKHFFPRGATAGDATPAHWADAESAARAALAAFPLAPSAVVHSGGGLHCYWFLESPLDLREAGAAARARAILLALARATTADPAAAEPARILRVPGSLNYKYDPARPVVLEHVDVGRRYELDAVLAALPPIPERSHEPREPVAHNVGVAQRVQMAKAWLARQEPAVEGQSGDNRTFSVAASVAVGHDLDERMAFEALRDWNGRCAPPWSEHELLTKIRNAIRYAEGRRGDKLVPQTTVELVNAADVRIRKLDWLWFGRLAYRTSTLFEGPPEKGKSTILADLAARISQGHSMPNEPRGQDPANVVMLTAEDALDVTVVPRLVAAGADLRRVFFLSVTRDERGRVVPFHISDDCERLRAKCREVDATVVMVDPLVSYLGSRQGKTLNTANDLEVRRALAPLKDLAEDLSAVVMAVRHYRKGPGTNALEAGGGSVGFTAMVRVILAALPDPDDATRYLFAVSKNNLVSKERRPAIAYRIVPSDHDPDIGRIAWGEAVNVSAGEILEAEAEKSRERETGAGAEAKAFLLGVLGSGEWKAATEIFAEAENRDISEITLRRAKAKLGIESDKKPVRWFWRLRPAGQGELFRGGASGPTGEGK